MPVIPLPDGIEFRAVDVWSLGTMTPTPGGGLDRTRQQWLRRENRVWINSYQVRGAWRGAARGAFFAFLDQLAGPANTFTLPVRQLMAVPTGAGSTLFLFDGPDMLFDDGTDNALVLEGDNPFVAAAAPAGATLIQTTDTIDALFRPGVYFSIDGFLYRAAGAAGGAVTFNPPLRQAVAEDDEIAVVAPEIRVRLADDSAAAAAHVAPPGEPYYLALTEAFER